MENSPASSDSLASTPTRPQLTLQQRSQATLARYEEERKQAEQKRRAGREKGEPNESLREKLKNCNIPQLRNVKKLCDRHIKRQQLPPSEFECRERYTLHVLSSVAVKNLRFQLEFRRTSLRSERVYVNGPYPRCYWWDGSIVKSKHIKKDKTLRLKLPKKVWLVFRDLLDRPENEQIRQHLLAKLLKNLQHEG